MKSEQNPNGAKPGVKKSSALTAGILSTLLFTLLLFPLTFLELVLHEGGHALVSVLNGEKLDIFYAHPFAFNGYVRGGAFQDTALNHVAGVTLLTLVSLVLFILLWKRRSLATLPLVMLFPWAAFRSGLAVNSIANHSGDYYNIMRVTGLPAIVFTIPGILFILVGLYFFISLFPLLGLAPQDKKSLLVFPIGFILWQVTGYLVAHMVVPGSPIDLFYHLEEEILSSTHLLPTFGLMFGALSALLYITLYRVIDKKLPASLRTEKVNLTWRDLRWPAVWAFGSMAIGLYLIL
jgi:hypothetical protein